MNNKFLIIAEIGQAHDGSLGILHSYIDALADTGVNAVKFQTHIADAESSMHEPFRVPFSYVDKTRYDYWKRMEFTADQWLGIKQHCDDKGVEFISSPFSIEAVNLLENLNVKRYKIASGEISNKLMLNKIRSIGKPVILSSGLSDFENLAAAINYLSEGITDISLLQCTTMYPTPPEHVGLNVLPEYGRQFNLPYGISDHSGTIYPCLAAAALGATIFEFHAVFDKKMFGPDSIASLDIGSIKQLVDGLKFLEIAVSNPVTKDSAKLQTLRNMFGKSIAINKDLHTGHILTIDDLESKKPAGFGVDAIEFEKIIGKTLSREMNRNDFLNFDDVN